jgi:hypothetical protein
VLAPTAVLVAQGTLMLGIGLWILRMRNRTT